MKKILIVLLFLSGKALGQDTTRISPENPLEYQYEAPLSSVDSLLYYEMRRDSVHFVLELDTVKQLMLFAHYQETTDVAVLAGIVEDIMDLQDKTKDDNELFLLAVFEVNRITRKLNTKSL